MFLHIHRGWNTTWNRFRLNTGPHSQPVISLKSIKIRSTAEQQQLLFHLTDDWQIDSCNHLKREKVMKHWERKSCSGNFRKRCKLKWITYLKWGWREKWCVFLYNPWLSFSAEVRVVFSTFTSSFIRSTDHKQASEARWTDTRLTLRTL